MARPKGPEKKQVIVRLLEDTFDKLELRAEKLGYKSLSAYLSDSIEDSAERFDETGDESNG